MQIFYWLMATRATRLSNEHVQSLNRIELEFRGRSGKEKAVRKAWRIYADHLNLNTPNTEAAVQTWAAERERLFTDLLMEMAQALGYDFDRVQIMRGIYYPRGHGELEERQRTILIGLERVLSGQQPLPMNVVNFPVDPIIAEAQRALLQRMATSYTDEGSLRVCLTEADNGPPTSPKKLSR